MKDLQRVLNEKMVTAKSVELSILYTELKTTSVENMQENAWKKAEKSHTSYPCLSLGSKEGQEKEDQEELPFYTLYILYYLDFLKVLLMFTCETKREKSSLLNRYT